MGRRPWCRKGVEPPPQQILIFPLTRRSRLYCLVLSSMVRCSEGQSSARKDTPVTVGYSSYRLVTCPWFPPFPTCQARDTRRRERQGKAKRDFLSAVYPYLMARATIAASSNMSRDNVDMPGEQRLRMVGLFWSPPSLSTRLASARRGARGLSAAYPESWTPAVVLVRGPSMGPNFVERMVSKQPWKAEQLAEPRQTASRGIDAEESPNLRKRRRRRRRRQQRQLRRWNRAI